VPELILPDVRLHVEVDGEGDPVMVLAHGITNSCRELALLTPFVPGTKVRFCFRGHGHSSSPASGYRFADFARDLRAVSDEYGARVAIGTSLGAGAVCHILQDEPDRFDKLVFLLPAALDQLVNHREPVLRTVDLIERAGSGAEAMALIMSEPDRLANYARAPWQEEVDRQWLSELNMEGIPRAIREIVDDWPLRDRDEMAKVTVPTLIIGRRGDVIHPAEIAETLAGIMPNAELLMFEDGDELFGGIPRIVERVVALLTS
jgi:pimeloyl-ACP methyl ester carboxylesterase